ncbi:MAG: tripartite tricarboxylate transporter TctB family protein [Comamonadaceae bacterium]|nr:MAG: tripartite tricarboxylate transporter TctB family protein [Comamonadaceae bacterium]
MKIKSQKDFFSGLMFMGIGVAFAIGATNYNIGNGARMGPGYFPLILGILLAFLGAAVTFYATVVETGPDGDKVGKWAWKQIFFILASNFAFGILLAGLPTWGVPAMGLIVAIYGLVFIAAQAGDKVSYKETFILATVLAVGSYVAFVWALKLQFPVWPSFISG